MAKLPERAGGILGSRRMVIAPSSAQALIFAAGMVKVVSELLHCIGARPVRPKAIPSSPKMVKNSVAPSASALIRLIERVASPAALIGSGLDTVKLSTTGSTGVVPAWPGPAVSTALRLMLSIIISAAHSSSTSGGCNTKVASQTEGSVSTTTSCGHSLMMGGLLSMTMKTARVVSELPHKSSTTKSTACIRMVSPAAGHIRPGIDTRVSVPAL